jgi:hypothetical protein
LEHAASVAKTFITSDAVVVDIKVPEQAPAPANPMAGGSGTCGLLVHLMVSLLGNGNGGVNLCWFSFQVLDSKLFGV